MPSTASVIASARTSAIRIELVVGDDERRAEQDRVAVDAVGVARPRVDQDTAPAGGGDDGLGDVRGARERPAGLPVRDELEADQQAAAADLADVRVVRRAGRAARPSRRSPFRGARRDEVLVVEDAQHLARHRRPDRRVRVREAVDEPATRRRDRVVDRPEAATNPNGQ